MMSQKKRIGMSFLFLFLFSLTLADIGYGGSMMGGYCGGGFINWIAGLLVLSALVLLIIWLYKQIWNK